MRINVFTSQDRGHKKVDLDLNKVTHILHINCLLNYYFFESFFV